MQASATVFVSNPFVGGIKSTFIEFSFSPMLMSSDCTASSCSPLNMFSAVSLVKSEDPSIKPIRLNGNITTSPDGLTTFLFYSQTLNVIPSSKDCK